MRLNKAVQNTKPGACVNWIVLSPQT